MSPISSNATESTRQLSTLQKKEKKNEIGNRKRGIKSVIISKDGISMRRNKHKKKAKKGRKRREEMHIIAILGWNVAQNQPNTQSTWNDPDSERCKRGSPPFPFLSHQEKEKYSKMKSTQCTEKTEPAYLKITPPTKHLVSERYTKTKPPRGPWTSPGCPL